MPMTSTAIPVLCHWALGLPTSAKRPGATQTSAAGARFRIERLGAEIFSASRRRCRGFLRPRLAQRLGGRHHVCKQHGYVAEGKLVETLIWNVGFSYF